MLLVNVQMDRLGNGGECTQAYLRTAGVVCVESEQFGLVVGDQRPGSGTNARISLVPPCGHQSPSLRAAAQKSIISSLTTAGMRSDEAM